MPYGIANDIFYLVPGIRQAKYLFNSIASRCMACRNIIRHTTRRVALLFNSGLNGRRVVLDCLRSTLSFFRLPDASPFASDFPV